MWFYNTGKILISLILMLNLMKQIIRSDASEEILGIDGESINGKTLIQLGRRLNKPMLTLIGMAMKNLHQCSGWTQWTECGIKISSHFGIRNRSRECIPETSENDKMSVKETDLGLCEFRKSTFVCPKTYNFTSNGFCIKLQVTKKYHDDAEAECNKDGGYLINMNSDLKNTDVQTILSGFSGHYLHIGGRRKSSTSPWEFNYGATSGYTNWRSGYPNSETFPSCLSSVNLEWFDYDCSYNEFPFLCEIPK